MKRLCIILAAVAVFLPLPQAFSMPVENVQVKIIDINGGTSAPLLEKMKSSMQIVAEQLLLEKDSETIRAAEADYVRLFSEIGDRVFNGYELQKVELRPEANTAVVMYLRPWNATIGDVRVDLQFSGMDDNTAAMLKKSIPGLELELQEIISGASVDAIDWAGSILRRQVREKIEDALPEFKAAVDLSHEDDTGRAVVQVVIYPVGESVNDILYEMHSETIPNLVLMKLKYSYADRCDEFRGLPVAYMKRHRTELENLLMEELRQEKIVKQLVLTPKVSIIPGKDTKVDVALSSKRYKIWLEGYADLGRRDDNISGKMHIGKYFSPHDEIFGELKLVTDDMHWSTELGYARTWGKSTWSYRRRIPEADNVYKLEYDFGGKWGVRMEHYSGSDRNEYAVRYRIHEFLSAEYTYGGKESYLRIIGNL